MSTVANVDKEPETNRIPAQDPDDQAPNCLAQADVKTPWLDINARFHLRTNSVDFGKRKSESSEKAQKKALNFFSLPKFRSKKNNDERKPGSNGGTTADGAESAASDRFESSEEKSSGTAESDGLDSNSDIAGHDAKSHFSDNWHDLSVPKKKKIWQGGEGIALTIFGIALPALTIGLSFMSMPHRITLVTLNHPLETIAEIILLLCVPLTNFVTWKSICDNNFRFGLKRGIALGSAIISCLILAGVCVAGLTAGASLESDIGSDFAGGFTGLASIAMLAAASSAYIVNRFRITRDFKNSRLQVLAFTAVGAVLSLLTVAGAEYRPWMVRAAEKKASSTIFEDKKAGLAELRALAPERELLMECSDAKAAGLAGLFNPIKPAAQQELYFAVTGKPYSFKDITNTDFSSMPDDYLSRHVIGDKIEGLSMRRSYMSGNVHTRTLSSSINWTFVFKNDSKNTSQEARAEIGLPPGAVINGLKVWKSGAPVEAKFVPSGKAEGSDSFASIDGTTLGVVSDLGHGRSLIHCFPYEGATEYKAELSMVVPLTPDGASSASLSLPKFLSTNFDLKGDHVLKIKSDKALTSTVSNLKSGPTAGGVLSISGNLTPQQLENSSLILSATRSQSTPSFVVLDKTAIKMAQADLRAKELERKKHARKAQPHEQVVVMIDGSKGIQNQFDNFRKIMALKSAHHGHGQQVNKKQIKTIPARYVVANVVKTAAPAPKEFVVVIDGSATMQDHIKELTASLSRIPNGIPTHVIVASQEHPEMLKPMSLQSALTKLPTMKFEGGQENLESVVKAAELAGETKGGAILWAHGPLPALNEEVYIVPQYQAQPNFYELPLGSGATNTYDFFKNHAEIGPFFPVPRNTDQVVNDVGAFFSKWKLDENGYSVELKGTTAKPEHSLEATPEEAKELFALHANSQIEGYLNTHHITKATRLAVEYGLLSPVSCAITSDAQTENADQDEVPSVEANAEPATDANDSNIDGVSADKTDSPDSNSNNTSSTDEVAADGTQSNETDAQQSTDSEAPDSSTVSKTRASSRKKLNIYGATNGTIGSDGSDGTYITGVNTAGTVRVNNLANLEALLNIISNLFELGAMLVGCAIAIHSFGNKEFVMELMGRELEMSQGQRIAIGIGLILFGLAFPGIVNWFVASARDVNLFS